MPQSLTYLINYWMLYIEFVDIFKSIKYKDIPIPLFLNFYQFLDNDVKEKMETTDFDKYLKVKKVSKYEIQSKFEEIIEDFKGKRIERQGNIVLSSDNLRFSKNNFVNNFDTKNTVILSHWAVRKYLGYDVYNLNRYKSNVDEQVEELIIESDMVFKEYSKHILVGNSEFKEKYTKMLNTIVSTVDAIEKFIDEVPMQMLIVGSCEGIVNRSLALVSLKKGIHSICLQHGLIGGEEAFMPAFTECVAVYGKYEKDWYLERGLDENRINVTGHPKYDDIFIEKFMSKDEFCNKYNISKNKKIIMIATQPIYCPFWRETIFYLSRDLQQEIIIKVHPWEVARAKNRIKEYQMLANNLKNVKIIKDSKTNAYNFISNIDVMITMSSTIGLEAMLFRKQFLTLSTVPMQNNFYSELGELNFTKPKKLARYVSTLIRNKDMMESNLDVYDEFLTKVYPQRLAGTKLKSLIKELLCN